MEPGESNRGLSPGISSTAAKESLHGLVHRETSLRVCRGLELVHLALPLPGLSMGVFRPIDRVQVRAVDYRWHHGAAGCGITTQYVGDRSSRNTALSFQQIPEKAEGRQPSAARLHQDVDCVAIFALLCRCGESDR